MTFHKISGMSKLYFANDDSLLQNFPFVNFFFPDISQKIAAPHFLLSYAVLFTNTIVYDLFFLYPLCCGIFRLMETIIQGWEKSGEQWRGLSFFCTPSDCKHEKDSVGDEQQSSEDSLSVKTSRNKKLTIRKYCA